MRTDALFYQVFQEIPSCYFELIGAPPEAAAGYQFGAEELKQTGLRVDGVFVPNHAGKPVHFLEVFCYKTAKAYSNLFAKVFLWLELKDPAQDWHACVIFASRKLEPTHLHPYRALLGSAQVTRVFLDELPEAGADQVGLGILELIATSPQTALTKARSWLARLRRGKKPMAQGRKVVELIEMVLVSHFPHLGRQELEHMLQIKDLRETKVYQEGRQEGQAESREEIAVRLLARNFAVSQVAELTGLPVQRIRMLKKKSCNGG